MRLIFRIKSMLETRALASSLADCCLPGDCITLSGQIGIGKTQFARHFLQRFTSIPDLEVPSPTFMLDLQYQHRGILVHHMDLYRMTTQQQLDILDLDRVFESDVSLIEWPDRLGSRIPEHRLDITIADAPNSDRSEHRMVELQGRTPRWYAFLEAIGTKYEVADDDEDDIPARAGHAVP